MLLVREEPLAVREQPAAHRLGDNLAGKQGHEEEASVNSGPHRE